MIDCSTDNSKNILKNLLDTKIVYGKRQYNLRSLRYGSIWNRLIRTNVKLKGIYTLNVYLLNAYKNFWEYGWRNQLINEYSFSYLMINREGYIYICYLKVEKGR